MTQPPDTGPNLESEAQPSADALDRQHQPPTLPPPPRPHRPRLTVRDPRRPAVGRNPGATARTHAPDRRHHDAATDAHDPPPEPTSTAAATAAAAATSIPDNAGHHQKKTKR